MDLLKKYLREYLNITQSINSLLEADIEEHLDKLDSLIESRENIKEEINKLAFTKEEFKSIVDEIGLIDEDEKMGVLLSSNLDSTKGEIETNKKEMNNISKQRIISNKYMNFNPIDPVFLSKKY
ncbi:MAG: hypothetical protein RSA01_04040 [Clostridium sp.]|uniref:hypothetical protein n=1 Tax=Clostridium sp. TaxID=1506 RepID=UPI002FC99371